jgi:hypothetical protein
MLTAALMMLALCAPGVAAADLNPGDIGTEAYTRMDAETFALDPAIRDSDFWRETVAGGASAVSRYRWPIPPATVPSGFTCAATGCTGYSGRGYGRAEASGTLHAAAYASLYLGNEPADGYGLAGYIFADGRAALADTITLSAPATVVLRGRLGGSWGGSADTDDQPTPRADLSARIDLRGPNEICDIEWCEQEHFGGWRFDERAPIFNCPGDDGTCAVGAGVPSPTDHPVDESFSVAVSLPAGTSYLTARLAAAIDFQVYGDGPGLEQSSAHLDFANSLRFELEVPDHVVATSGSGLLTIVGGASAADTTPPTVVAPAGVTVGNDPGRADASVDPGTATATDDNPGVTVAASRSDGAALSAPYPVGTTTITWTATDAAGNTASATQTVTVNDVEKPSLSVPTAVAADATGSAGAAVSYVASAADNVGVASHACAPASGSTFAVGDTTVTCIAADAAGNVATAAFVVHVRGADELLAALGDALTEQSLKAKVAAARASLAAGNTKAACNQLSALVHHVDAQDGKKLTSAEATVIRQQVAAIRAVLGC